MRRRQLESVVGLIWLSLGCVWSQKDGQGAKDQLNRDGGKLVAHAVQPETPYDLQWATGMDAIYFVNGSTLKVFDASGVKEVKAIKLEKPYKRIREREAYFVALSNNSVDLLDKQTFAVKRSVKLVATATYDLDLRPDANVAFATVFNSDGGQRSRLESYRLLAIDENSGTAMELPRMYGSWVSVDPAGRNLHLALKTSFQIGSKIDWNIGEILPAYGDIDILARYEMVGNSLRHAETNLDAGTNGRRLVPSPDGKHVAYVSGAGTPQYSYAIPAYPAESIKGIDASYKTGAYPHDLAFHPTLDLVVGSDGKQPIAFKRSTGEVIEDKIDLGKARPSGEIARVFFTPDGANLVLGYGEVYKGLNQLVVVPLKLDDGERATIAKGFRRPKVDPRPAGADTADAGKAAPPAGGAGGKALQPLTEIQALVGRGASRQASAKQIAGRYMPSVVVVKGEGVVGSGVFIGEGGYILTCAHVLPLFGDPMVSYQKPGGEAVEGLKAKVLSSDPESDLALIKIEVAAPVAPVQFYMEREITAGEQVTVIGNPGLGNTVLKNSVTTGIVSSPARELGGETYIQTSAATNPGNSGGPLFDERGRMIGIITAKAELENTGFAIPVASVLRFLGVDPEFYGREIRSWSSASGSQKTSATLLATGGDAVFLRKEAGDVVRVLKSALSEGDREYIGK